MKQPHFEWDEELGLCYCELTYNHITFIDAANCHEDDWDMKSRRVGEHIALTRCQIQVAQHIRDNELRPQLKALKQLHYSINRSKEYRKRSYESRMLYKAICRTEKELKETQELVKRLRNELQDYITNKDNFYKKLRLFREYGQNIATEDK